MRNICNQKYVDECVGPIMRLVFSVIRTVLVVRSDDSDLEALVRQKNGRVTTPFGIHDKMTFHQLNKFALICIPRSMDMLNPYCRCNMTVYRWIVMLAGQILLIVFTCVGVLCSPQV